MVCPSSGSGAYQNSVVNKGGLRSSKWVTRSQDHSWVQKLSVVGLDQECNTQMGLAVVHFPKPTGQARMVVGESSLLSAQRPLAMSTAPHDLLVAKNGIAGLTDAVGSLAVESSASPAPLENAGDLGQGGLPSGDLVGGWVSFF